MFVWGLASSPVQAEQSSAALFAGVIQQIVSRPRQMLSHIHSHRGRGDAIDHDLQVAETGFGFAGYVERRRRYLPGTSRALDYPAFRVLLSALAIASAAPS